MTTPTVSRLSPDQFAATDRQASGPSGASGRREPAGVAQDSELRAVLEPMLEAIVRLADASAGTISVIGRDGAHFDPVVAIGLAEGRGALGSWCPTCDESGRADSECVRSALCGHDERIPADALGPVCRHVVAVPLRHRERPVGTLNLMFSAPCALSPAMTPLLRAVGDLIGTTLDNVRLARENLRIRLGNERQMLASEVHDALAQGLAYMRMRMNLLRDAIDRRDELRARKFCSDVDDTLGNSQQRLRELITYFRSRMDPRGLVCALEEATARFRDRTGIALEFTNRAPDLALPAEREIEVFHVVQEALANVSRHARATRASLWLERRDGDYRIVVEDDGVGIAAAGVQDDDSSGHYGIAIMRERARRLGGALALAAAAGGGTRLELTFPATAPRDEALP